MGGFMEKILKKRKKYDMIYMISNKKYRCGERTEEKN